MSSFVFDALVRFLGKTHLTYAGIDSIPAPGVEELSVLDPKMEALRNETEPWTRGELRADLDALIARAYGLPLVHFAAVLSSFPLLDRVEPMLPGEPKSFVTRDLALLTYAREISVTPPDIVDLLESAGLELPLPRHELRRLDVRVERHREIGAIPYRPTPKGGRPPSDPALIDAVTEVLNDEPQTAETIAEVVEEEEIVVKKVLESLIKEGECFAQGRGRTRSYYVIEE